MKTFVDNIFKYYLNDDWIQYPFHPINPDLVLKSRGGSRIEWCDYPLYYLSHNTDFYAFFESIARHRDIILNDYHQCANYIDQIDAQTRRSMFGNKLRTTRSQKSDIFTSERTFAHYLLKNEIVASDHNSLFSGFIMRD